MSKYVDDILKSIKENPRDWVDIEHGIKHIEDNIQIRDFGNSRILSLINVVINDKFIPTSYIDCWRLEKMIKWWYRRVQLEHLLKNK